MGQDQTIDFGDGGMFGVSKTSGSERWCTQGTMGRRGSQYRSQGCGKRGAGHKRPVPLGQSAGYVVARRHEIVIILGEILYVNRPSTTFV